MRNPGRQLPGFCLYLVSHSKTVMAAPVAAIHFPETEQNYYRLWKMDGSDEPGHDELGLKKNITPPLPP
jgi:hypothetical protein